MTDENASTPSLASSAAAAPPATPGRAVSFLRRNAASLQALDAAETAAAADYFETVVDPELRSVIATALKRADKIKQVGPLAADTVAIDDTRGIYMRVVVSRQEPALGNQVMKSDHWDGIHVLPTPQTYSGAPNFRKIELPGSDAFKLYGSSQPTVASLKAIVKNELLPGNITWINLREEPVAYVLTDDQTDGFPYAPRDPDTLNVNLDHLIGIDHLDLEAMEQRLKADILATSRRAGGSFSFFHQDMKMNNVTSKRLLSSAAGSVKTPREVFESLTIEDGFPVSYFRIPCTDESAPDERDFAAMVEVLKDKGSGDIVVFNCQMGRGRTTTGIVVATLIYEARTGMIPTALPASGTKLSDDFTYFESDRAAPSLPRGEFDVILRLIDLLDSGDIVKFWVDSVIARCAQIQNLRSSIYEAKLRSQDDKLSPGDKEKMHARALSYLERYWHLILFGSYLYQYGPSFNVRFDSFMAQRWGVRRLLRKLTLE